MPDECSWGVHGGIEVTLDGMPVRLPSKCRSLNAIRCRLETLALEKHRVLCSLSVDGEPVNLSRPLFGGRAFGRIDASTVALKERPVLLLKMALEQAEHAMEYLETAIPLVLINDVRVAHEIWWILAMRLKEPVLTLSLLPDDACGPANGRASLTQLRQWQLEQVAAIIRDVEKIRCSRDTIPLSDALEKRVMPWARKLLEFIKLWYETAKAGSRLGISCPAS